MLKNLLTLVFLALIGITGFAQTAPDFTAPDCNGNSHDLYSEVNSGKVLVLVWVMPCATCINGALTAYNIVQSYANPNVLYYLIDDLANTSCTTLDAWGTNNHIGSNRQTFSTAAIVQSQYGGTGMPHVAVIGRSGNTYFNGTNQAAEDPTGIQNGIDAALAATAIEEKTRYKFLLSVSQSPSSQIVKVSYSLDEMANANLELINDLGQAVMTKTLGKQSSGIYNAEFDMNGMPIGIYFVRLDAEIKKQTVRFVLTK